jgi:hypothetical protein
MAIFPQRAVVLFDPDGVELSVLNGVAIPANTRALIIAGSDSGTARYLRTAADGTARVDPTGTTAQPVTDNAGSLTVDTPQLPATLDAGNLRTAVEASVLPTGAATEATLATRATEATLATRASEATLATRATEATLSTRATEATLSTRATEATVATLATSANQTNGTQRSQARGGTKGATTPADVTSSSIDADHQGLDVADGGGSLTVDAPVATPVAARLSDGAAFLSTPSSRLAVDGSGVTQPVSDAGGSLTVDTPQLPAALVGGRLDENVGAWLGSTAPTVGQKAMASSVPVVIASDQSTLPVKELRSTACAHTSVAGSDTSVTLLAANANRIKAVIRNDSTANLFLRFENAAATTTSGVLLGNGDDWEEKEYNGEIRGIWSVANGNARIMEFT